MKIDLETVRLRRLARSDGPAIRAGLEDGKIARNMGSIPFPYPEGYEYKMIEKGVWQGVVGLMDEQDKLLGFGALSHSPDIHNSEEYDIGYMIFEPFWNQGIGTRAVELLIKKTPKDARVFADVMIDNLASMRVFEKLGFVKCGEGVCNSKGRGEEVPTIIYELKR